MPRTLAVDIFIQSVSAIYAIPFHPIHTLFTGFLFDRVNMAFYGTNLGVLFILNSLLFYRQRRSNRPTQNLDSEPENDADEEVKDFAAEPDTRVTDFVKQYLVGHLLAFAADWLQVSGFRPWPDLHGCRASFFFFHGLGQESDRDRTLKGPHLYAVYKYDKKLTETHVAALYATGFISAALSGAFAGQLADRYGRKRACLVYCATYTACCLSMLSDNLYILFAGRFCGGISTTLLFSAFDAWMNTEYHKRGLEAEHLSLSTLYGWLTSCNSVVAITTGITGEILVLLTGTRMSPFLLAAVVLGGTAAWISSTWVSRMTFIRDSIQLLRETREKTTAARQIMCPGLRSLP